MANQYSSRLTEEELDLRRMVYENTRIKQYFTVSDPFDLSQLAAASGQTSRWMKSTGRSDQVHYSPLGDVSTGYSVSSGENEVLCRDLTWTWRAGHRRSIGSIVWIQRGAGFGKVGWSSHMVSIVLAHASD